jgi:hypothetical protein
MYDNVHRRFDGMATTKGPEHAILEIIRGFRGQEEVHVDFFTGWHKSVEELIKPDRITQPDLRSAFKRLCKLNLIHLTKAGVPPYKYAENEEEDVLFFYREPFTAKITDEGKGYWDSIRVERTGNPIGFVPPAKT